MSQSKIEGDSAFVVSVQLLTERGERVPTFVIRTDKFDKVAESLRLFPLSLMPVGIPLLNLAPHNLPPAMLNQGRLMIEFSFDDIKPGLVAERAFVSDKLCNQFEEANRACKAINIILEAKRGWFGKARSEALPGRYDAYVLDWWGISGLLFYIRNNATQEFSPETADSFNKIAQIMIKEKGLATNIYTEMGFLYRLSGQWDKAIECYTKEIQFGLKANGQPGIGTMRAFCNLGTVYKKQKEYARARDCYTIALALNPNYYEALLSIGGIVDSLETSLKCFGRALCIRPQSDLIHEAIDTLATHLARPRTEIAEAVWNIAEQTNLSVPLAELQLDNPKQVLARLEL